jgi:hypothetical protein
VVERERLGPADGLVNETAEHRLDYLTIPLLAEMGLPQQTILGVRPSLYVGPEVGLNLRARARRTYRTRRDRRDYTTEVETPPVVAAAVAGAEIAYRLPKGRKVALDLRYSYGLTNVVTKAQDANAQLGTIQAGVCYYFSQ